MSVNENTPFKLPIEYIKHNNINEHIKNDLELNNTQNKSYNSVYHNLFNVSTDIGKKATDKFSNFYTHDSKFLKDSQSIIKSIDNSKIFNIDIINNMLDNWTNIKNNDEFLMKHQYIEWDKFLFLNESVIFLTLLTIMNIFSPILQVLSPFFILLIPFFILKIMPGQKITLSSYITILKQVFKNNAIGRLIFDFNNMSFSKKIQSVIFAGFYIFNLYQNCKSCYAFCKNQYEIHSHLHNTKTYLEYSLDTMKYFKNKTKNFNSYKQFNLSIFNYETKIQFYIDKLNFVNDSFYSYKYISKPGNIMQFYYLMYNSKDFEDIMNYTYGFNGYMELLNGVLNNIKNKRINKTSFSTKNVCKFKDIFHPSIQNKPIKNNINLKSNKIITGPNASGKTTILKSTIINIILSQQIGFGYFNKATINPFHFIHCYINIPDNCSRDSLFQSEAKRCKNILDSIVKNKDKRHFCVFDELYSGTNPYEAVSSATSFLKFISKNNNVKFILTTHFLKLCHLLNDNKNIENLNMKTEIKNDIPHYYYKITKGISKIKGGICILKQLNYPQSIIDNAKFIISSLN